MSSFITLLFFSLTKINKRTTATITNIEATGKANTLSTLPKPGSVIFTFISLASNIVPKIVAIPPIVFITPLASLLKSPGTISGIKATTGPLTACLAKLSTKINAIRAHSDERAAIGISEESDAIAIVVSEETGKISIAVDGNLNYNLSLDDARMILVEELKPKKEVLLDDEFVDEKEDDNNEKK